MNQDSFRQLLSSQPSSSTAQPHPTAHVKGTLLTAASAGRKKEKKKTEDASQPVFKPRTIKKGDKDYRDRAAERRQGVNADFAQVEALAEDFERRNAENADREAVEEQRKYLGGDSQHTVLVKGLDFALLEQNRARAAADAAVTEDVSLEEAFLESSAQPKKRTREEIMRELKSKRAEGAAAAATTKAVPVDTALEEAKRVGKFKPIGFKPVGAGASSGGDAKAKRKKKVKAGEAEENGERKKRRKVVGTATAAKDAAAIKPPAEPVVNSAGPSRPEAAESESTVTLPAIAPSRPPPPPEPEPVLEPLDEDVDIFAGAGEYTGVDIGDDSDEEDDGARPGSSMPREEEVRDAGPSRPSKWLATSDDEQEPSRPPSPPRHRSGSASAERPDGPHRSPPPDDEHGQVGEQEEERPTRLQPLASSAVPSIKDLLAMKDETQKMGKKKAKKEKKKSGGGGGGGETDTKAKVERDYQRLKAYTDKKGKV